MKKILLFLFCLLLPCLASMEIEDSSTNVTVYFILRDVSTSKVDETIDETEADFYWVEELQAQESDTTLTSTTATAAHLDGGFVHVGEGVYRCDFPDDCFDGGDGTRVQLGVIDPDKDDFFSEWIEVLLTADTPGGGGTPAEVAAAVWDETASEHIAQGSTGNLLYKLKNAWRW